MMQRGVNEIGNAINLTLYVFFPFRFVYSLILLPIPVSQLSKSLCRRILIGGGGGGGRLGGILRMRLLWVTRGRE